MIVALNILHIAVAAAWFGHKLLLPADIRASAGAGAGQSDLFLGRLRRAERLGVITGLGTLVSGGALMWAVGWETVRPGVWVGTGLVVGAIVSGFAVGRPATRQLVTAVARGDRVKAAIAGRRVNQVLGAESLLWLGALSAMVV